MATQSAVFAFVRQGLPTLPRRFEEGSLMGWLSHAERPFG